MAVYKGVYQGYRYEIEGEAEVRIAPYETSNTQIERDLNALFRDLVVEPAKINELKIDHVKFKNLNHGINIYFDVVCSYHEGEPFFQAVFTAAAGEISGAVASAVFTFFFPVAGLTGIAFDSVVSSVIGNYVNSSLDSLINERRNNSRYKFNKNTEFQEKKVIKDTRRSIRNKKNEYYVNYKDSFEKDQDIYLEKLQLVKHQFKRKKNLSLKKSDYYNKKEIDSILEFIPSLKEVIEDIGDPKKYDRKDYFKLKILRAKLDFNIKLVHFLRERILYRLLKYKVKKKNLIKEKINNLKGIGYLLLEYKYKISSSLRHYKSKNDNLYNGVLSELERLIKIIDDALKGDIKEETVILPQIDLPHIKYLRTDGLGYSSIIRHLRNTKEMQNEIKMHTMQLEVLRGILQGRTRYPVKEETLDDFLRRKTKYKNKIKYIKFIKKITLPNDARKEANQNVKDFEKRWFWKTKDYLPISEIKSQIIEQRNKGGYTKELKRSIADYIVRKMIDRGEITYNPYKIHYNSFIENKVSLFIKDDEVKRLDLIKLFNKEIEINNTNKTTKKTAKNKNNYLKPFSINVNTLEQYEYKYKVEIVLSYKRRKLMDWEPDNVIISNPDLLEKYYQYILKIEDKNDKIRKDRKSSILSKRFNSNKILNFFKKRNVFLSKRKVFSDDKYYNKYKNEMIRIEKEELNKSLNKKYERVKKRQYHSDNKFKLRKERNDLLAKQQKYENKLKNTNDKDEIKKLKKKINQISEVLYSDKVSDDNPYGSKYKFYKKRQKEFDDKIVMKSLIRGDTDYDPENSISFEEYINEKFKNLNKEKYKALLEKGKEFQLKVDKVLKYIWNNPKIDSSLFTESYLYNNPELVELYYKQMKVENQSESFDEKIIVYKDSKAIFSEIDKLSKSFENHRKNIVIHNNELNVTDNSVNRGPQILA